LFSVFKKVAKGERASKAGKGWFASKLLTVRRDIAIKLPRVAKHRLQKPLVGARGLPIHLVVRAHDAGGLPLGHAVLEAGKVGVHEVLLGDEHVNVRAV